MAKKITKKEVLKLGFTTDNDCEFRINHHSIEGYFDSIKVIFEDGEKTNILIVQKEIGEKEFDAIFIRDIYYVHELELLIKVLVKPLYL